MSYIIPVYLGWRKKQLRISKRGSWHLGNSSGLVNALGLFWTLGICTLMVMPLNSRAGWEIASVIGILLLLYLATVKHKIHKAVWELGANNEIDESPTSQATVPKT